MNIQEAQEKLAESKMDNVCKFIFNELATFVDWYAISKGQNEHYINDILLLANKMSELTKKREIKSDILPEITLPTGSAEHIDKVIADAEKRIKEYE